MAFSSPAYWRCCSPAFRSPNCTPGKPADFQCLAPGNETARYDFINEWERLLDQDNTTIRKFFLYLDTLEAMDLKYPPPHVDLAEIRRLYHAAEANCGEAPSKNGNAGKKTDKKHK
ncbi:MAG: hypothetical protein ACLQLT_05215 [Methylovirgula sp.]